MCIELILDAESASLDAHALNYMKMIAGNDDTVTLQDEKTGENFTIKPITIINAAGPWIDQANRAMEHSSRLIGGTKGSHIVLRHPDLRDAIGEQEFFFENEEINRSHIVYRFSGVRPLPFGGEKQTGQISRDHQIKVVEPRDEFQVPVYCLVGGKWTTFRAFAEQITDIVLNRLGRRRKINTEILPIGGGADYPRSEAERQSWLHSLNLKTGLPMARLEVLFERYGTRAVGFVDYFVKNGDKSLKHHWAFSRQEVELLVQQEKILHLEDLVLRRTSLAKLGELTTALLDELASILTIPLDWSERERKEELERTVSVLYDRHGVKL
jgi:glycerol-3-phosphate dehydrogenase